MRTGVFTKPQFRVTDDPQQPGIKVLPALHQVEHLPRLGVVVQGIDREIPAKRILLDASVGIVGKNAALLVDMRAPGSTKGCDLHVAHGKNTRARSENADQSRGCAQTACGTSSGCASVAMSKSLGDNPSSRSRTPAADQVRLKSSLMQSGNHTQCIPVDVGRVDINQCAGVRIHPAPVRGGRLHETKWSLRRCALYNISPDSAPGTGKTGVAGSLKRASGVGAGSSRMAPERAIH